MNGPVIREIDVQNERRCVGAVVKRRLAASLDGLDYLIAAVYRPELLVEVGVPLSERIVYTVRPGRDGRLVDTEGVPIPDQARLLLLDRATAQQSEAWPWADGRAAVLDSFTRTVRRTLDVTQVPPGIGKIADVGGQAKAPGGACEAGSCCAGVGSRVTR